MLRKQTISLLGLGVVTLLLLQVSFAENDMNKPPRDFKSPLEKFDKDGDNRIAYDEAPSKMQENFDRHDLNGDGFIDGEELDTLPKHPPRSSKKE